MPTAREIWAGSTWAGRRNMVKVFLFPYLTKKENVILWLSLVIDTMLSGFVLWSLGDILFDAVSAVRSAFLVGFLFTFTGFALITQWMVRSLRGFTAGLNSRNAAAKEEAMKKIMEQVDAYGRDLRDRLAKATGRTQLADDPISMAAAALEASDKTTAAREAQSKNPLQAALNEDLHALDDMDREDEDDNNKPF